MDIAGILAILCSLLGIPLIVFGFIYLNIRSKQGIEIMKIKKEMLALEIEKERLNVQKLEAENTKYDRIIDGKERFVEKE
jgi:uncharacterized membrane protein